MLEPPPRSLLSFNPMLAAPWGVEGVYQRVMQRGMTLKVAYFKN